MVWGAPDQMNLSLSLGESEVGEEGEVHNQSPRRRRRGSGPAPLILTLVLQFDWLEELNWVAGNWEQLIK